MRRIFVAGHKGMVGSAICRKLSPDPNNELITATRDELDLLDQSAVHDFFYANKIDCVYLAAAKVGGIHANHTYPAEFIYENIMIQANVINAAFLSGVQKLLFLGSSCIYPRYARQPMRESSLLSGQLECTNEPYALAKISGIKMCESYNRQYGVDYRSVMPTNLYGPGDNFHPENSHVIPALIRRFDEAKKAKAESVTVWGSGSPMREFLHVDDLADASVFLMNIRNELYETHTSEMTSHVNIGTGLDCTIKELTSLVAEVIDFKGEIAWDTAKPDGPPRKLLDVSCLKSLGWSHAISLRQGLQSTYQWYVENLSNVRQ